MISSEPPAIELWLCYKAPITHYPYIEYTLLITGALNCPKRLEGLLVFLAGILVLKGLQIS